MELVAWAWKRYNDKLEKHPLPTKVRIGNVTVCEKDPTSQPSNHGDTECCGSLPEETQPRQEEDLSHRTCNCDQDSDKKGRRND